MQEKVRKNKVGELEDVMTYKQKNLDDRDTVYSSF